MKIKTYKKLAKLIIIIKTTLIISSNAYAQTLLTCDAPNGKGYYYQGPLISKKLAGWAMMEYQKEVFP